MFAQSFLMLPTWILWSSYTGAKIRNNLIWIWYWVANTIPKSVSQKRFCETFPVCPILSSGLCWQHRNWPDYSGAESVLICAAQIHTQLSPLYNIMIASDSMKRSKKHNPRHQHQRNDIIESTNNTIHMPLWLFDFKCNREQTILHDEQPERSEIVLDLL